MSINELLDSKKPIPLSDKDFNNEKLPYHNRQLQLRKSIKNEEFRNNISFYVKNNLTNLGSIKSTIVNNLKYQMEDQLQLLKIMFY